MLKSSSSRRLVCLATAVLCTSHMYNKRNGKQFRWVPEPFFGKMAQCKSDKDGALSAPPVYVDYFQPDAEAELRAGEFVGDLSKLPLAKRVKYGFELRDRDAEIKELQSASNGYDVLVVGAGASGAGVALEAASRGIKCAVIDKFDFASGTSSRSTKMAHGGIRYFEQMMLLQGDPVQSYELLREALHERNFFLQAAPYLNKELNLLIPGNTFLGTALWFYPGAFLYHLMYMKQLLASNYSSSLKAPKLLLKKRVKELYPDATMMHGKYGVLMQEAQMNDSRMAINSLFTSSIDSYIPGMKGATLANYVEFRDYVKDADGKIVGAKLFDNVGKKEFEIKSKVVVNCTGIHADELRLQDNAEAVPRIQGARGTHLMFKKGLVPADSGVIIPKTKDGRLIFIINYLGHPMVGTTDEKCEVTHYCAPTEKEIDFICQELQPYFGEDYDFKGNLMSAWAGIRPLVKAGSEAEANNEPWSFPGIKASAILAFQGSIRWLARLKDTKSKAKSSATARLSRTHVIEVSDSGLVSLMGGKWTSFRRMGEETVEEILRNNKEIEVKHDKSQTLNFNLIGSYSRTEALNGLRLGNEQLFQQYEDHLTLARDLPRDVAQHLIHTYGTTSLRVVELGERNKAKGLQGVNEKIHPDYPFLKSEISYGAVHEMAQKPNDIICRRVPIAFLNRQAAEDILPEVVTILGKERKWSSSQSAEELKQAKEMLAFLK